MRAFFCTKWGRTHRLARGVAALLVGGGLFVGSLPAVAQETTLRAVSAFTTDNFLSEHFLKLVDKINAEGKGLVQVRYIGGPEAIPTFEVGNAVRNRVVDMANVASAFYTNVVPEAMATAFTEQHYDTLRQRGAIDFLNTVMAEKNLIYLARTVDYMPFHIYTNKGFDGSLAGQRMRTTGMYRDLFLALGAAVVQTSPAELYTALERGMVDGYGWPTGSIFDLGWHEKTKYRVDPGFYNSESGVLMNLDVWNSLRPEQRDFLQKQFEWVESLNVLYQDKAQAEKDRQAAAGIQTIQLSAAKGQALLEASRKAAWGYVRQISPQHGERLEQLFGNQP